MNLCLIAQLFSDGTHGINDVPERKLQKNDKGEMAQKGGSMMPSPRDPENLVKRAVGRTDICKG